MNDMTAKEFLMTNPKIAEAVENGYDIRLDENEIIEAMERYYEQRLNSSGIGGKRLHEHHDKHLLENFVDWLSNNPEAQSWLDKSFSHGAIVKSFFAACASGGVDTVAEDWVATPKPKVPLEKRLDNLSKKIRARKSSEGQP
jgi:hypothetical protein